MKIYFYYDGEEFEKSYEDDFRSAKIREEIRSECLQKGKTHKEIQEAFDAFGI
ncbi:hypothetical protein ACXYMX_04280 [Sporosarcina sp. CAU 1771]